MSRWFPIVLVLGAALTITGPARAYTYGDTLTLIWKPLPNLPSFVQPGQNLTVWANAPSSTSGWTASLRLASLEVPLTLAGGGWQPSLARWVLEFAVPSGVPEELYDLALGCTGCTADLARHAVKVLPVFKEDFYFAQITDTHIPSHPFSDSGNFDPADTSGIADFSAVIADLNLIRPEFVILTGDVVNEGELEEYLGMYELGRAQEMFTRLRDPIFVSSGNHDIGGWRSTPPPDGTSRKNWWRYFGWPFLGNPPAGDPHHSQDYSFDYGDLHVVGLESYINSGAYDSYRQEIWGPQSFTSQQMSWLGADLAAAPPGRLKLVFYHYDFGGHAGNPQINPAALGIDGAIWGHFHSVPEGNRAARPFNLGLQAVIDGRRVFRIFRVEKGVIAPGPMHRSGGTAMTPTDSLQVAWSGPNDGTRSSLSATVTNRFGESWDRARLVFYMADHDSAFAASGGTLAQIIRHGGTAAVYLDYVLPAGSTVTVSVAPTDPASVPPLPAMDPLSLDPPAPNPFRPDHGTLALRFSTPLPGPIRITVYDLSGRRVGSVFEGPLGPGTHTLSWSGSGDHGRILDPGVYVVRLEGPGGERRKKVSLMR